MLTHRPFEALRDDLQKPRKTRNKNNDGRKGPLNSREENTMNEMNDTQVMPNNSHFQTVEQEPPIERAVKNVLENPEVLNHLRDQLLGTKRQRVARALVDGAAVASGALAVYGVVIGVKKLVTKISKPAPELPGTTAAKAK